MLNITSRANYGLRAMLELALHFNQGVLQGGELSKKGDIPKNYLEQLLNVLKKTGLIQSLRGNKGGYKLSRPPENISLSEIIHSLEGPANTSYSYPKNDAIKQCYIKAEHALASVFQISLRELLNEQEKIDKQLTFYI